MTKGSAAAAALIGVLTVSSAFADDLEIGMLTCKLTDVTNAIIYTNETFNCEFVPGDGAPELYTGQIKSVGVDLSVKNDMTIVWAVIAPSSGIYAAGNLRGTYVGGSVEVSVGAGVGAKVLVGGGENSFTLQPVSVSGIQGGGASLGVQSFELK